MDFPCDDIPLSCASCNRKMFIQTICIWQSQSFELAKRMCAKICHAINFRSRTIETTARTTTAAETLENVIQETCTAASAPAHSDWRRWASDHNMYVCASGCPFQWRDKSRKYATSAHRAKNEFYYINCLHGCSTAKGIFLPLHPCAYFTAAEGNTHLVIDDGITAKSIIIRT